MITSLRHHQRMQNKAPAVTPPPASVPYAEHQTALRDLERRLTTDRKVSPPAEHVLDVRSSPEVVEIIESCRQASERLQAVEADFATLWNRTVELEAQLAERDARIVELEAQPETPKQDAPPAEQPAETSKATSKKR